MLVNKPVSKGILRERHMFWSNITLASSRRHIPWYILRRMINRLFPNMLDNRHFHIFWGCLALNNYSNPEVSHETSNKWVLLSPSDIWFIDMKIRSSHSIQISWNIILLIQPLSKTRRHTDITYLSTLIKKHDYIFNFLNEFLHMFSISQYVFIILW